MSPRKLLGKGTYGVRGRSVRLWIEGDLIRAQWREAGTRHTKSWSNTPENRSYAKAWAAAFVQHRERPTATAPVTTRDLWQRFAEAELSGDKVRKRTHDLYEGHWRAWEVFVTPHSLADDLGVLTMTEFRTDREKAGWAVSTIGSAVQTVKMIYKWGTASRLLTRNEVRDYRFKVGKGQRRPSPDEYTRAEWEAILAHLPTESRGTWRARAVLELCGLQGARQNAVLHLQWEDVDLEAGELVWRAAWDKTGQTWRQPMRERTRAVIAAVRGWHERTGVESPWLFPAASRKNTASPVYSPQSLWLALTKAERAAGVSHKTGRGAHGARRMVFGDVLAATGSIGAAMDAINDRDLKVARRYHKQRLGEVREAFAVLDAGASGNRTATAPAEGAEAVAEGGES